MDLRVYYRKWREIAEGLETEFVVVKSLATADGGVAGRLTEVAKSVAARLLLEGGAERASEAEAAAFRKQAEAAKQREEQKQAAAKLQFTVLTEADLRTLPRPDRGGSRE